MTKELVYVQGGNLDKGSVVTNSFIVSEKADISHKAVKNQIVKREKELRMFGNLTVFKIQSEVGTQYDEIGYELNEEQATLLFTFLRNTEQVIKFKVLLVKAFYSMRNEIVNRKETRDIAKIDRNNLTKMIEDSGEQERMHNQGYSNYTNLVYKSLFGMNKKQLCESKGIVYKKDMSLREFLTTEEIESIRQREVMVTEFIKLEYDYGQIKNLLKVK